MKTAVVILNWNGKVFLEKFLPSLVLSARHTESTKVIVADNASEDGSMQMLAEKFPEIGTIALDRNYGFAGGYNRALSGIDSEYYLLINSDIEVPENWLSPLVQWMDTHPECGICAPKLHSYADREMFEYAGAAGGYIDMFGYPFCRGRMMGKVEKDYGQYDTPAEVFWASGACLLIRSGLFRKLGGFDERFFAHMEEIDLCWRAKLEGYGVMAIPYSVVYHIGGGTLPNDSPRKLYLNYRNNLLMLQNNLAMTLSAQYYANGKTSVSEAASMGIKKAGRVIAFRKFLDMLSGAVYLCALRFKCAKAVSDAHRDFRKLGSPSEAEQVERFLEEYGHKARINGIYRGWMIPTALLGRKIKL